MAKSPPTGSTPFDEPALPPAKPERKKATRTPLSKIMRVANAIDRLLNRLSSDEERRRALNVVMAAQASLPFEQKTQG